MEKCSTLENMFDDLSILSLLLWYFQEPEEMSDGALRNIRKMQRSILMNRVPRGRKVLNTICIVHKRELLCMRDKTTSSNAEN